MITFDSTLDFLFCLKKKKKSKACLFVIMIRMLVRFVQLHLMLYEVKMMEKHLVSFTSLHLTTAEPRLIKTTE